MMRSAIVSVLVATLSGILSAQTPAVTAPGAGASRGVGVVEAYQELLKENLDLRNRFTALSESAAAVEKDRGAQRALAADLEQRLVQMAARVRQLEQSRAAGVDTNKTAALESSIERYATEQQRLTAELADLRARLAAAPAAPGAPGGTVAPGSALYRKLEEENARLKQRIGDIESQRERASQAAAASQKQMEDGEAGLRQLQAQVSARGADRESMLKLVKHVKRLQEANRDLEQALEKKNAALEAGRKRIGGLEKDVREREDLARKAVRASALVERIEQARQVRQMTGGEQIEFLRASADRHVEHGRYDLAERDYLKALALDSSSADLHYNLGIVYDTGLGDKRRAVKHYGAYLDLAPNAPDADRVKAWMREADMGLSAVPRETVAPPTTERRVAEMVAATGLEPLDPALVTERDAACSRAEALLAKERYKEAAAAYRRALDADPNAADVHYNLGVLYDQDLKDKRRAVRHYEAYLRLCPRAGDADRVYSWLREAQMGL
jgi:tetratricopeptide (TPR) repeat protein